MKTLCTSLGSWDTIEAGQRRQHGMTFPLAILAAVMREAGMTEPDCYEGEEQPAPGFGLGYDVLLVSAMDSRHFWRLPPFLRRAHVPVWQRERSDGHPLVVMGGQAACAPAPVEPFVDVVFVGEAEAGAAELLRVVAHGRAYGWTRAQILERVATLAGCLVPSRFPAGHTVAKVEAGDISITLRNSISVSHATNRRVEIARGCKSRCGFCALGWRSSYRENTAPAVVAAIAEVAAAKGHQIHLSAGDAEGHSEIEGLRGALQHYDMRDHGWTGRLDTIAASSISAGKQFAFGIEGLSHRLRKAVGKPKLTNDYILSEVGAYWRAGGRRLMFHLIGDLPGETDADADEFRALIQGLDAASRTVGGIVYLEVGRQPFGPLPHTPMQWFEPGRDTARVVRAYGGQIDADKVVGDSGGLSIIDKAGQSPSKTLINAITMRGGSEVVPMVLAGPPKLSEAPMVALAQWMGWVQGFGLDPRRYLGRWDVDAPLPWDHVTMPATYGRRECAARFSSIVRGLSGS